MGVFKDEKRSTWYCKLYYTDWRGERKQHLKRGFKLKKDAQAYEADYKKNAHKEPEILFSTLAKEFLADFKLRRKYNSYKLAEANLRIHILPHVGRMKVNKITPNTIRTWQNIMLASGLKQSTLQSISTTFKSVMTFAARFYNLVSNPFSSAEKIGKSSINVQFLEDDDWSKLSAVIQANKHYNVLFNLLYWSGMRIGELQALGIDDFDFEEKTITISKQYSSDRKEIVPTKTSTSNRTITMPDNVMALVKEYFDSFYELPPLPFAIKTSKGINFILKSYCKKAGIGEISVHAFRHTHASFLIRQGTPPNLVAQRLGHASAVTTMKLYAHCYQSQDKGLAIMMNELNKTAQK